MAGLAARCREQGIDIALAREPGGTPLGDAIRGIFVDPKFDMRALTEALLVNASRVEAVAAIIGPALASGRAVLCDRFVDSTLAYQGFGRGVELAVLRQLCALASGGLQPDLTLLLDVPVDLAQARITARQTSPDRLEQADRAFHERVRGGYLTLAREQARFRTIDGSVDSAAVLDRAWLAITGILAW